VHDHPSDRSAFLCVNRSKRFSPVFWPLHRPRVYWICIKVLIYKRDGHHVHKSCASRPSDMCMTYMTDMDTTHRMWYHETLQTKTSYALEGATALEKFHAPSERTTDQLSISCR
jgi:hypothetical protein